MLNSCVLLHDVFCRSIINVPKKPSKANTFCLFRIIGGIVSNEIVPGPLSPRVLARVFSLVKLRINQ